MNQQTKWSQFGVLIIVFFFWGFVAASNSIFIPFCKTFFNLDQIQSQLIGSAFYGAYFYGSFILYVFSTITGTDLLNKIGYKKGIIYGLLISVVGALALAYISGSGNATFGLVLVSFFIIALGFSLQQTAAQPFAIGLGSPETGAHRFGSCFSCHADFHYNHRHAGQLCHHQHRSLYGSNVALYICPCHQWYRKIHQPGFRIPDHDDPWWSHYPSHSRFYH